MTTTKEGDILLAHCNQCLRKTRHEVIAIRKFDEEDEIDTGFYIDWLTTYIMLECRGCSSITLQHRLFSHTAGIDSIDSYPPPISRQIPRWHCELPSGISGLLKECYAALNAGSKRLAIMGARSVVDVFINDTIGDVGGFKQKLDKLVEQGYLSSQNRDTLDVALEAGHAVVHRGHMPNADDVTLVFDIVENMLQTLVLKKKSEKLKENTPIRKKTNK